MCQTRTKKLPKAKTRRHGKILRKRRLTKIERNDTWKLVPLPVNAKPVKSKWVFVNETDHNLNITRPRARLVAKGYTQTYGIHYTDTFAPVAKYTTLRFMLALATQKELWMLQLDVRAAFLNGTLEETIYLEQPEGFIKEEKLTWVYLLLKALYGLKQAPRACHMLIRKTLLAMGFRQSEADCSLFIYIGSNGILYILVYADDLLSFGQKIFDSEAIATEIGPRVKIRMEKKSPNFWELLLNETGRENVLISIAGT